MEKNCEGSSPGLNKEIRHLSGETEEITKTSARKVGVPINIQTTKLPNMNPQQYH
jgi:hypothetical protein